LRTQAAKLNFVPAFTRKQRLLLAIIPPLAALLIRALGATLRYRDITAPGAPIGIKIPGPTIFAFWHRTLLIAAHRFRNHNIAILISASFDGELIARTVALLGFHPVRGSSSRGGAPGLRAMAQAYTEGHICAFTADGPRGAFHGNPSRAWQLNSWDRFLIPKPFSTVTFAWPAHVAPDLTAVQRALDEAVRMSTPNS
jgi:hypothetical protein